MQHRGYSNLYYRHLQYSQRICVLEECKLRFSQEYFNNFHPTVIYRKIKVSFLQAIIVQHPTKLRGNHSYRTEEKYSADWKVSNCLLILHHILRKETQTLTSKLQTLIHQVTSLSKPSFRYRQATDTCTLVLRVAFQILFSKPHIDTDYNLN